MTDLADCSLWELEKLLRTGQASSQSVTAAVLQRLSETDPLVGAYAHIYETAVRDAEAADERRKVEPRPSPLLGIPIAIKDVFHTADAPTEAGSRVLRGFQAPHDATAVSRLRTAGAVLVGKTVTHEFAYGMNTPRTRNPWNLDCYPGGSSAGSAVSVAVGSAVASIGTDTAGSVRTPAAVNGVVGFKPTYGRISRAGVVPASPSMDHVGIIGRCVRDCAAIYEVIAGHDPLDAASLRIPINPWTSQPETGVAGKRVGVDRSYFLDWDGVAGGVRARIETALEILQDLGVHVVDVRIPLLDMASAVGSTLMTVDYSVWHREHLQTKLSEYEPGTRRMLMLGYATPATAYVQAQRVRKAVANAVRETYMEHRLDALIGPTIPLTAPTIQSMGESDSDIDLSGLVHHSFPANLVGLPCVSVRCGLDNGMPVGMQILGRPLDEATTLTLATAYEAETPLTRPIEPRGGPHG